MQQSPTYEDNRAQTAGQRRYRAEIAYTILDYATEESSHSDCLTAHVLPDTDGAVRSQLQHSIARAGIEWPGIDETIVVSQTGREDRCNAAPHSEDAWFYLCFRHNDLFALLTPAEGTDKDNHSEPSFECALLKPSARRRRSRPGETRYHGTSASDTGEASWRVTLSDEGFKLRLSRINNERQALVTLITAITDDDPIAPGQQPPLPRTNTPIQRLKNWLSSIRRQSTQRHTQASRLLASTEATT